MAASDPLAILQEHDQLAIDLVAQAKDGINAAVGALVSAGIPYQPFAFTDPVMAFGSPNVTYNAPFRPNDPNLDDIPEVQDIPRDVPEFTEQFAAIAPVAPVITIPGDPSPSLPGNLTPPASTASIQMPSAPSLVPLGDTSLPYNTLTLPTSPTLITPVFSGKPPDDIASISLSDYLALLTSTYTSYAQTIPALVQSNWRQWYAMLMADHPLLPQMQGIISTYLTTGGSGVPTTIEDAIVTRAQDRSRAAHRRASSKVWDEVAKRGLWMPSGALLSGLKESAQLEGEAVSKVATDVAIKNIELEHDHMKFMLDFGKGVETLLCSTSMDIAKVNTELNGQAIEITKTVLTGMIEINKAIISIYLAKWEGYKAAVEVYKAQIQANELLIEIYKAQISAEMAKLEINKSKIMMFEALINANNSSVMLYKTQIEAETAKLEVDRTRAVIFEAQVRGFVAQIEGYRARWEGYKAQVEGQQAKANIYESQVRGFLANVQAYAAKAGAYESRVRGYAARTDAISKSNIAELSSWTAKAEGLLKAFGTEMEAYKTEWSAAVEQVRIQSVYWQSGVESIRAFNSTQVQQQMEMGREHLAQWVQQLEGSLRAADGLRAVAGIQGQLAGSVMSGVTSLASITEQVVAAG